MLARWRKFAWCVLFAAIAAAPLRAVEPVLDDIQPRGGQRGKPFTLTLKGKGLTDGADLITSLPAAVGETLPVTLTVAVREARAVQGMDFPIPFKLLKTDPTIVTKKIEIPDIPVKDASIKNRAEFRKDVSEGTFLWTSSTETPLGHFDLVALATVMLNGEQKVTVAPAVSMNLVGAYIVELKTARLSLRSGGKVELAGVVRREPEFKGTVKLSVGDLPDKVTCSPVELPDGKSEFRLSCEANPGAPDGEFDVHLVSSAAIPGRTDKQEYKFPPVTMHMTIGSEKVALSSVVSHP